MRNVRSLAPLLLVFSLGPMICSAQGTTQESPALPAFEVVSVRADIAPRLLPLSKVTMFPGGRFQAHVTLRDLIARAYALQPYQRIKGSASVLDEWFVMKESCAVVQAPPPTDPTRAGTQQLPCHVTFINGHMTALVERMADFSRAVSFMSRRAVVDETGLDGSFELEMTFNPATFSQGLLPFPPVGLEDLPAFADALRQELGLKVETERRAVPVLIVENVENPTDN